MSRRGAMARRERRVAFAMIAPSVALLAGVALYPILWAVWLSLRRRNVVFHEDAFIGLAHYRFLAHDARFWSALGNTAIFSAGAVAIELALGLAIALLLQASFRGRGLLRAAVLVPWAVPTVVSAKMWGWLYNAEYGLVPWLLGLRGLPLLGTPGLAMLAAIVVDVWKTTPFVALLLLAGLQSIPPELYEVARIDGASRLRTFVSITLPLLRPAIVLTLVFRTLDAFRVFDAIYVLTDGGPANTTETLSIYAYKTLMRIGDFGYGSALSVVTFLCVMAISVVYLRLAPAERTR
jgi:multiple sugar transport system permease protein